MTRTTAIVVTYQSADVVGRCLDACIAAGIDAIVVDNASRDGSAGEAAKRNVRVIANKENRGFASAVNQGVAEASTEFILLLNPDAVIVTGIGLLEAACRRPGIAAAAGKLVDEDGRWQRGFSIRRFPTAAALCFEVLGINRLWPSNPANLRYRYLDRDENNAGPVEQPAGAFLLVRRDNWNSVGGMDERFYPVWFEDVDFCKRLVESGHGIEYVPAAVATHKGAHSANQLGTSDRQRLWYGSLLRYAALHLPRRTQALVAGAVAVGGVSRLVMGICKTVSLEPAAVYGKVIRLALHSLCLGSGGTAELIRQKK
ncbi:MAG: glycosyltransferase family 2 protein [Candidatus Solibacter usitatus]|nr:glycosyltransferase family 2 protein [Candidatus Solibacter usitatus]